MINKTQFFSNKSHNILPFHDMSVTRGDPKTGKKLMQITLPVIKPTSCCFSGPNYDIIYITTAIFNVPPDELSQYPLWLYICCNRTRYHN